MNSLKLTILLYSRLYSRFVVGMNGWKIRKDESVCHPRQNKLRNVSQAFLIAARRGLLDVRQPVFCDRRPGLRLESIR
jgi:hypothetical protein